MVPSVGLQLGEACGTPPLQMMTGQKWFHTPQHREQTPGQSQIQKFPNPVPTENIVSILPYKIQNFEQPL